MRIRSAGLAALVAAAGIWMSFSVESAMAAKSTTKTEKAAKITSANRPVVLSKFKKQRVAAKKSKSARHAIKSTRYAKKAGSKVSSKIIEAPETWEDKPARSEAELPPSVANARAQALAEDEARNFAALDSTDVPVADGMQLAAADQLTDSDRAATAETAQDSGAPAAPVAVQPAPVQSGKIIRATSASEKPVFKTDDGDPWSKTSLIGKIFIAFGSLLTLASAARLLIT